MKDAPSSAVARRSEGQTGRPDVTGRWIRTGEGSAELTAVNGRFERLRGDFDGTIDLNKVQPQEGRVVDV